MSDESPPRQRWWNIEGWGLRRKVTAVLAVPVTVAMVLGGLRVENELSNAVHFSSAADQVAAVPEIVEFSTAFATFAASALAATVSKEDMEALEERFAEIRPVAENPEFDPEVTAELTRSITAAEGLFTKLKAGPVPMVENAAVSNDVRDSLNRIVETILSEVSDETVREYGERLTTAWYSQRHIYSQVLGIYRILEDPTTPSTDLVSASGGELAMLDLLAYLYPAGDTQIAELRNGVEQRTAMVDAAGEGPLPILTLRESMLESVALYNGIISDSTSNITTTIDALASETRSAALRDTAIVLATLLAALVLALLVSRSLVGPIRRLRYGTLKVARQELPEAIDRIKVGDSIEDIEFTRVPVHTAEEIGQLARAVDDMHGQALRLAGEQAHLRLQINDMFETLARRSKSLVEQQLGVIEQLEFQEKDPERLESLFRLDHLAARMRRNGDNLLILSGTRMRRGHSAPVQLGDVLRAAMSEVEDYQRVQIGSTPDGALSGAVATDIVHLLAELVDNSLRASPPDSAVTFSFARAVDGGLLVEIADRGIGIPPDELELINERLAKGGQVSPDTARHMGLFVVSRLAERHGLTVRLRPTFDTARNPGITASVHIPDVLLVSPLALSQTGPQSFAPIVDVEPVEVESGSARAELPAPTQAYDQAQAYDRPRDDAPSFEKEPDPGSGAVSPASASATVDSGRSGAPDRVESADDHPSLPVRDRLSEEIPVSREGSVDPGARSGPIPAPSAQQVRQFTSPAPDRSASGLPQRNPGSTPGLPQRSPGSTPGLPQRSPGSTPGLPQQDSQSAPRRIQPDAAAAFVKALPPRANRAPVEPPAQRENRPDDASPQPDAGNGADPRPRDQFDSGLPQRNPGSTPGLPQRSPGSTPGLPQRSPGAGPGLPQRPQGASPEQSPQAAPGAQQHPVTQQPGVFGALPRRRPGATPGLPERPDAGRSPRGEAQTPVVQPSRPRPADAQPQQPQQPDVSRSGMPSQTPSGLPRRNPGATPGMPARPSVDAGPTVTAGLPRRDPGATQGLPDSRMQAASIADGGSVSSNSDAQQAARHRYRTNSAKTASFFQPRPDVNALRPHPAAGMPIFTDMMSDWLVDPTELPEDRRKREWHSAADAGWEAAQHATEAPVAEHTTAGLPRRAPGERLVPGAVRSPATAEQRTIRRRDPEAIRANLSRHQQGVRNGRASATANNRENVSDRENNEQGVR